MQTNWTLVTEQWLSPERNGSRLGRQRRDSTAKTNPFFRYLCIAGNIVRKRGYPGWVKYNEPHKMHHSDSLGQQIKDFKLCGLDKLLCDEHHIGYIAWGYSPEIQACKPCAAKTVRELQHMELLREKADLS